MMRLPLLTGWVNEKYGGFNHLFYEKVFELLLRLKANFLWPAMWDNAFNEDDPLNPKLADEYGIVMGTSHHEPMLRAQQEWKRHGVGPWDYATNARNLDAFWEKGIERNEDYESIITLGMRGDGDKPMAEKDDIALLEKIVADQRAIIARHLTPTVAADPQVWALYKEVQGYYEKGMRVPDDVTLLWSDDNWGNIRRLPTADERKRSTNTVPGSICSGIHSLIMLNSPIIMPPRFPFTLVVRPLRCVKAEPVPEPPSSCATESLLAPGALRRSGIYRTSAAARFLTGPPPVVPRCGDTDECRR